MSLIIAGNIIFDGVNEVNWLCRVFWHSISNTFELFYVPDQISANIEMVCFFFMHSENRLERRYSRRE